MHPRAKVTRPLSDKDSLEKPFRQEKPLRQKKLGANRGGLSGRRLPNQKRFKIALSCKRVVATVDPCRNQFCRRADGLLGLCADGGSLD